jgi:peptidoglycan/xylan/chitin deacetylase (PgdA/CDA1 family)
MKRPLLIVFVISIMLGFLSIARADTSVALWQGDKNGAVSITFDDGSTDQIDLGLPMLKARGLKATFFMIGERLQYEWYSENIPPLVEDGQEIGSHGFAHDSLTDMDPNQVEDELYQSQATLQELTGQDVATIAYPYGDHNTYVEDLAKEYYIAARSTDFPGVLNPADPNEDELYRLFTTGPYPYYVGNQTVDPNVIDPNAVAYLQEGADRAASGQGWFIEMLHGINSGWDAISEATLETHLDYLTNEPNVWVAPMGTVSEYIYEREGASITTSPVQDSNTIQVDLECGLDPDYYDTPLTLLTPCPPGWEALEIQVRQGSEEPSAYVISKDSSYYIMYDVMPVTSTITLSPTQAVYTLTASAGANGLINPSGEFFAVEGSNQLFTAMPDTGYEVDRWIVDSNEVQAGGTEFTLENVTADQAVSVTFKLQTLTVTASAGANGAIAPKGLVSATYGSNQEFTATPDPGYIVDQWFVDGDAVQSGGMTYDLSVIAPDQTIDVTFKSYSATVALWQGDKKGAVSITFNSGFPSQYNAVPELRNQGLKATFYRTTSEISDPNDILDLVEDGHEIGSQGVTNESLTALFYGEDPNLVEYELYQSQAALQVLTGQDIVTLAYPRGDYDPNVIDLTDDYYITARSTNPLDDNSPNGLNASSPILYELVVIETHGNGDGDSNAIAWLQDRVDLAVAEGKWAIEMIHDVNVPEGYDNISTAALSEHMDYLANESDVWVAPVGTVSEYIYERDAASITTLASNGNIISLALSCPVLEDDTRTTFDTPLTLLTPCPPDWESTDVQVQQGQTEQIADLVSKDGNLYLMYDAIPDANTIELSPIQPIIPDVTGQSQASAEANITAAGFTVGAVTTAYSDSVAIDNVISQSLVGPATSGTAVDLVVSLGLPVIPDVTGQAQATAEANITAAGFTVGAVTTAYSDNIAIDNVISQSLVGPATSDTAVDLVVSLGLPVIPDVTGQAQATAEANIVAATFTVGTVTTAYSDTVLAGNVISQGAVGPATSGTAIDLVVSLGLPIIPDVTGQLQATAEANITAAGFTVGAVTTAYSDSIAIDNVISQSLVGPATSGTAVDLVVSLGSLGPPIIPDVTGQPQATAEANIVAATFTVGTVTTAYSDTVAAGNVISQGAVGPATSGTAVDLVVSLGLPIIPDVTGQAQATAEANIAAASFTVGIVTTAYSDTVDAGNVISQSLVGPATSGTAVDLVISDGLAPLTVISGYLLEPDDITAIEGILIETTDGTSSDVTDPNGYYELVVDYGWSGIVEPNAVGYVFDPNEADRILTNVITDTVLNLTGSLEALVISGTILESGVTPIQGVTVTAENGGGYYTAKYDPNSAVDVTDPNGYYEVIVDYNWSGDVTPTDNAYTFDPIKTSYSTVVDAIIDQDYTGTMLTFRISGTIENVLGTPLEGVSVTADNGGGTDATDPTGYYEVWVPYDWSGNVAASMTDYTFVPAAAVYANVTINQADDFTAQLDADIDGDGFVGLSDLMILCSNWLTPGSLSDGNLDGIGDIDLLDVAEIGKYWLE